MKIGYVHNVVRLHRRQIKTHSTICTILILEFAQIFKETIPKNHPSALRPSINCRHNLSHQKQKQENFKLEKKVKKREKIDCLNCAPDCLQGFKLKFSWIFRGEAHRTPPQISSPLYLSLRPQFGLCPQFSGALRHGFGLCPQFSPPNCWPGCASETRLWHLQFRTFSMVILG